MSANVYLPDGSKRIVVPDGKVQDYLANGYIDETAWFAHCDEKAAAALAAWASDPETESERFTSLRQACEVKLAQTDYAMNNDYPISEESKTSLLAYRKAIRELNHQDGAPWDGGGDLTPWPAMPTITKTSN